MKTARLIVAVGLALAGGHISASRHPYHGFLYEQTVARVIPEHGFQSRIRLGDSIVKLVQHGVIDIQNFENLYSGRDGAAACSRCWSTGKPSRS
jgi:hypothetical protein